MEIVREYIDPVPVGMLCLTPKCILADMMFNALCMAGVHYWACMHVAAGHRRLFCQLGEAHGLCKAASPFGAGLRKLVVKFEIDADAR